MRRGQRSGVSKQVKGPVWLRSSEVWFPCRLKGPVCTRRSMVRSVRTVQVCAILSASTGPVWLPRLEVQSVQVKGLPAVGWRSGLHVQVEFPVYEVLPVHISWICTDRLVQSVRQAKFPVYVQVCMHIVEDLICTCRLEVQSSRTGSRPHTYR